MRPEPRSNEERSQITARQNDRTVAQPSAQTANRSDAHAAGRRIAPSYLPRKETERNHRRRTRRHSKPGSEKAPNRLCLTAPVHQSTGNGGSRSGTRRSRLRQAGMLRRLLSKPGAAPSLIDLSSYPIEGEKRDQENCMESAPPTGRRVISVDCITAPSECLGRRSGSSGRCRRTSFPCSRW